MVPTVKSRLRASRSAPRTSSNSSGSSAYSSPSSSALPPHANQAHPSAPPHAGSKTFLIVVITIVALVALSLFLFFAKNVSVGQAVQGPAAICENILVEPVPLGEVEAASVCAQRAFQMVDEPDLAAFAAAYDCHGLYQGVPILKAGFNNYFTYLGLRAVGVEALQARDDWQNICRGYVFKGDRINWINAAPVGQGIRYVPTTLQEAQNCIAYSAAFNDVQNDELDIQNPDYLITSTYRQQYPIMDFGTSWAGYIYGEDGQCFTDPALLAQFDVDDDGLPNDADRTPCGINTAMQGDVCSCSAGYVDLDEEVGCEAEAGAGAQVIELDSCQELNIPGQTYRIVEDGIQDDAAVGVACISITADNIHIECPSGITVDNKRTAIEINGADNVFINSLGEDQYCDLSGNIEIINSNGAVINHVRVHNAQEYALTLSQNSHNNRLLNSILFENTGGIHILDGGSDGNTFDTVEIRDNLNYGLWINSPVNILQNLDIHDNVLAGINLASGSGNIIRNNRLCKNNVDENREFICTPNVATVLAQENIIGGVDEQGIAQGHVACAAFAADAYVNAQDESCVYAAQEPAGGEFHINSCDVGARGWIAGATYYLDNDIQLALGQNSCFIIGANNVKLDCQGHTINGIVSDDTFGLLATDKSGLTVDNCNFRELGTGIKLDHTTGAIFNVEVTESNTGIETIAAPVVILPESAFEELSITESSLIHNKIGISIQGGSTKLGGMIIQRNTQQGILVKNGGSARFIETTSCSNTQDFLCENLNGQFEGELNSFSSVAQCGQPLSRWPIQDEHYTQCVEQAACVDDPFCADQVEGESFCEGQSTSFTCERAANGCLMREGDFCAQPGRDSQCVDATGLCADRQQLDELEEPVVDDVVEDELDNIDCSPDAIRNSCMPTLVAAECVDERKSATCENPNNCGGVYTVRATCDNEITSERYNGVNHGWGGGRGGRPQAPDGDLCPDGICDNRIPLVDPRFDLNQDMCVGLKDVSIVASRMTFTCENPQVKLFGDSNNDGCITFTDFSAIVAALDWECAE